MNYNSVVLDIL